MGVKTNISIQLQEPEKHMPKLFGSLRERYEARPGGYTRLLRCEPLKNDAAPSAILSLVDGPKDMRFAITAKALVRQREEGLNMHELTALNIRKLTRFRKDGEDVLEQEVKRLEEEKKRVEKEQKAENQANGATWKWIRAPNSGPGKMRKRKIVGDGETTRFGTASQGQKSV